MGSWCLKCSHAIEWCSKCGFYHHKTGKAEGHCDHQRTVGTVVARQQRDIELAGDAERTNAVRNYLKRERDKHGLGYA